MIRALKLVVSLNETISFKLLKLYETFGFMPEKLLGFKSETVC